MLEELAGKLALEETGAATVAARLSAMRDALAGKDGERDRVVALYRRERIDEATLDDQLDEIERERAGLTAEIARLEDARTRAREVEGQLLGARAMLRELNRRLDQPLTWEIKRRLVETLVDSIQVETTGAGLRRRDTEVHVTYCFAVPDASIDVYTPA